MMTMRIYMNKSKKRKVQSTMRKLKR